MQFQGMFALGLVACSGTPDEAARQDGADAAAVRVVGADTMMSTLMPRWS
ncbi:MAG: hypothetical protein R3F59_02570 [Myxococcota bacterium]